ncbi:hypothetical protein DLAC_11484 [Tieghemostelium lacteum]|uniref:Uncharacterized protein n=1 Tax=Tieghemostelium lacteum TaxID=361077 RepID=A0A152A5U4_TIELA|nr:hypothetical protein DLAC_11484 [Tieghemostelium lacteum]|eukprot:KYR01604.1 hypothetical protein DLAC_11484 [Tieghemostelium lacteum]
MEITKDLLSVSNFDVCFKKVSNIGNFDIYATVSQRHIDLDVKTHTVNDLGVDAWWKLTRILKENFNIITHTFQKRFWINLFKRCNITTCSLGL